MWFTRVSIDHPILSVMAMLALIVLGAFSYSRLQVEEFPDVKFPVIVISTTYKGASAEVVESDISRKVEEALSTSAGLKNLYSYSYQGRSVVVAEFHLRVNPEIAVQDVREKIAVVKATLRKEIDEPIISRINPDDRPLVSIAITSDHLPLRELTTRAEHYFRKQYQMITGVGQVNVIGGIRREIHVLVRSDAMRNFGVGVEQIIRSLRDENQDIAAGTLVLHTQERQVEIHSRLQTPQAFANIVVAKRGDTPVLLGQLALIVDGEAQRETISRVNGKHAITIDVLKAHEGNAIETAALIRKRTAELVKELSSEGIHFAIINDTSVSVKNALHSVRNNLIEGIVLTVFIVFLFLGSWRSTVITAVTLPVAVLGTFWFFLLAGFTINLITLLALSLSIGLLVDDAIVVRDNIVRHAAMGKTAYQAAMDGTREIALAVFATTMTVVAVFLPIGFMGGIIGRFFASFGLTVTVAVLLSMLVSFTLDPMLSSIWGNPTTNLPSQRGWFRYPLEHFGRLLDSLSLWYVKFTQWSLGHRQIIIAIAGGASVSGMLLLIVVEKEFIPQADMSHLQVRFDVMEGASLEYTEAKLAQVESALHEFPGVMGMYSNVNIIGSFGKNAVNVDIQFMPRAERSQSIHDLIPLLRERLKRIGGISIKGISIPGGPTGSSKPIYLSLKGKDFGELSRITDSIIPRLSEISGIVDLDTSLRATKPTLLVEMHRDTLARVGLSSNGVGNTIRALIADDTATTWLSPEGDVYDVKVKLASGGHITREDVEQLPFASSSLEQATGRPIMIPLKHVANLRDVEGPSQINRRSLLREVAITANLDGRSLGAVSADIEKIIATTVLPAGYHLEISGASEDMAESASYALSALLLGILFIYMILASQFDSLLQPFAIMLSIPLTLVGVALALVLAGSTLNIFSMIGIIMLMGLVTKNAILLVDFINKARKNGSDRTTAILEAARIRLRPILMTTFAMVFGMLPLAFTFGEGAEQRAPMAHAIIGGVIASSLLTLVVIPVVFTYCDDIGTKARHLLRKRKQVQ